MNSIPIGSQQIGTNNPCFLIAEGGLNHNGSVEIAEKMIETVAECGADAIKFQTYTTKELFAPDHPEYDKFQKITFGRDAYEHLQSIAEQNKIILLSTPFDEASADLLEAVGIPAYKIGSGEVTHLSFLKYLAAKGKPLILSTGMSTLSEIDAAVWAIQNSKNPNLVLLHCVSAYPCPPSQANVRVLTTLQKRYNISVGFSDHTQSDTATLAAVALGACVIEKHFTLSHHLPGWDHFFSYDPTQLKRFVHSIRELEKTLGSDEKEIQEMEKSIHQIARRAIYARKSIEKGEILTQENLIVRRPAGPLPADWLEMILGKKVCREIPQGEALHTEDVEET